ncbi:MAG TPA: DUF1559 domain-containing protein [Pirellulales bacterium]|nr:DUF1559 domain-containing protein [Pirellulales bacterium]
MRDAAAIGQILNCPKCQSMVLVQPPAGWQPGAAGAGTLDSGTSSSGESSSLSESSITLPIGSPRRRWENQVQPGEQVTAAPATAGSGGFHLGDSGSVSSSDVSARVPAALASGARAGSAGPEPSAVTTPTAVGRGLPVGWVKWGVLAGAPAVVVVLAIGIWFGRGAPETAQSPPERSPPEVVEAPSPAPVEEEEPAPPPAKPDAETEPQRLARRRLPTRAQVVVSLRPRALFDQPAARVVLDRTTAFWQGAIDKLASALGIEPQTLERTTWVSTKLADISLDDWLTRAVVVIELDRPIAADARGLRDGEPLGWKFDGQAVRELKSRSWPHPFALLDKRTIITGPEAELRELAGREEHRLANETLGQLIDDLDARSAAIAAVDLRALREADALPRWLPLVDMLHADADDWELLRGLPLALGLAIGLDSSAEIDLGLACDGRSSAEQVDGALDRVLKAVEGTIDKEAAGLTDKLMAGQINTALASELKQFLSAGQIALAGHTVEVRDSTIWAHLDCQGDLPKLASGFLASVPQLEESRLVAARGLDEQHHRLLLEGLAGYVKAEGSMPAGAAGATLLPPESRLSWQATLLPYYGHLDWHGELNFARSWNDAINQRVTRRPLELMVNPALGPSTTKAGFPVTHYVGVAGLGADAGQLDPDDPRAGVFGFRPRVSPAQIPDGASNTIALAGVSEKLGAWASGGAATVRGLTQRPYINGPDGFGSGQPGGMLVGMADGSVRFIPKEIDPEVLERLVTINGGDAPPDALVKSTPPTRPAPDQPSPNEPGRAAPAQPAGEPNRQPKKRARVAAKEPDADLARHLSDRIPQIELKDSALSDLVDFLSQFSTIPMTLDADALSAAGVEPDARVSLSLTNTTVGEVLDQALRQHELKYIAVGGQLIVTGARQPAESLELETFDVGDLVATEPQGASRLAGLIETFVAPTAWQASGGAGSIKAADRSLDVQQTASVTSQAADFLDRLRIARELPVSRREGRRLSLATRWARARDKVRANVTANFAEPTPLKQIAAHLQKTAGIEIAIDGLGLASGQASPDVKAKLSANQQPLGEVLDRLLEPLKLGYRIVNGQRLEITSARDLADELELEFYTIKPLLGEGPHEDVLDQLIARIRKSVAPSTWREHGGSGVMMIDAASSYLIVLASQPVQIELERWLDHQPKSDGAR